MSYVGGFFKQLFGLFLFCGAFYKKKKKEDFISTEAQTRALAVAGVATHNNNQLVYSYVMAALFPAASGTSSHHACHRNFTTRVLYIHACRHHFCKSSWSPEQLPVTIFFFYAQHINSTGIMR